MGQGKGARCGGRNFNIQKLRMASLMVLIGHGTVAATVSDFFVELVLTHGRDGIPVGRYIPLVGICP